MHLRNPPILGLGLWDSHDNHRLPTKNLSVVGRIIHNLDINARLSWCLLSHSDLHRVNSFQLVRTSYHFRKLLSVTQKVPSHDQKPFAYSECSLLLSSRRPAGLTQGSLSRYSQKIPFSY